MRAGDVILFHRDSSLEEFQRDPYGTFMTALIHWTTHSRWNHAAIAVDYDKIAEATSTGVMINALSEKTDEIIVIPIAYDDEEDRLTAVAWAVARAGVRYGYFNAFMCGVNNVLAGLHLAIKSTDAIICSELVAEALTHAGFDFKKDCSQVSPGDLATFFGVAR